MRFKDFLNEEKALPTQPTSKKIAVNAAIKWAKQHAPEVMKNVRAGKFNFVRGVDGAPGDFQVGDTANFKRVAKNTKNYYMKFIATSKHWTDFPSRESAFIGASTDRIAGGYGTVYQVIPADNAKIGICPSHDLWKSFPKIEEAFSITGLNSFNDIIVEYMKALSGKVIDDTDPVALRKEMASWTMKDLHNLAEGIPKFKSKIPRFVLEAAEANVEVMVKKGFGNFEQLVEYCLDPHVNGFKTGDAHSTIIQGWSSGIEVWMEGKALFVKQSEMEQFLDDYKNG